MNNKWDLSLDKIERLKKEREECRRKYEELGKGFLFYLWTFQIIQILLATTLNIMRLESLNVPEKIFATFAGAWAMSFVAWMVPIIRYVYSDIKYIGRIKAIDKEIKEILEQTLVGESYE